MFQAFQCSAVNSSLWQIVQVRITKTRLFKYTENFTFKNWKFSDKNPDIFHNSAQNMDCGYSLEPPRRGGSNEYPQSMFLSRNKKNNVYLCIPQFYYIKVGFKRIKIIEVCLRDGNVSGIKGIRHFWLGSHSGTVADATSRSTNESWSPCSPFPCVNSWSWCNVHFYYASFADLSILV